ncbi:MAG TPA: PAS domain S-box protein [Bryobacteraceae bacterium]|jgi:PAS domain S-box-containing protein|nr:PAS domain S-box protein [Bryobacteraceae bacterium]
MGVKTAETSRSRNASEGSAIGIAVTDPTGRFHLVNRAYSRITGYSERELASRTFQNITHPDDLQSNWRLARLLFSGEVRGIVYEKRYIRKDSGIVWVRNSCSMVNDSSGNPVRSIALTEPIADPAHNGGPRASKDRGFRLISKILHRPEEEERRRIARDLHDGTGQLLTGLVMTLTRLQTSRLEADQRERLLADALDLACQCSREVRTLSYLLHPPLLNEFGLAIALQTYAEGFSHRTGIELKLRIPPDLGRLPREVELTIFRIVQEGLANIHKHSGSPLALVTLERSPRQIVLELMDWGRGLAVRPAGVGLVGMRERAQLLGGRFQINSSREGTRITAILPLSESDDQDAHIDRR